MPEQIKVGITICLYHGLNVGAVPGPQVVNHASARNVRSFAKSVCFAHISGSFRVEQLEDGSRPCCALQFYHTGQFFLGVKMNHFSMHGACPGFLSDELVHTVVILKHCFETLENVVQGRHREISGGKFYRDPIVSKILQFEAACSVPVAEVFPPHRAPGLDHDFAVVIEFTLCENALEA